MRLNGDTHKILHITANVIIALFHQQAMAVAILHPFLHYTYANNAIQMDGNHFAGDRKMVDTPSSLRPSAAGCECHFLHNELSGVYSS
jgi:hypothetical protein